MFAFPAICYYLISYNVNVWILSLCFRQNNNPDEPEARATCSFLLLTKSVSSLELEVEELQFESSILSFINEKLIFCTREAQ